MLEVGVYQKKPVQVKAVQWDGSIEQAREIMAWVLDGEGSCYYYAPDNSSKDSFGKIKVSTLEGVMDAFPRDWIIRGIKGEFYPCKPDIFEGSYELPTDKQQVSK